MLNLEHFTFSRNDSGGVTAYGPVGTQVYIELVAGPVMMLDAEKTNLKADHPDTARVVLAAARWHRANK